MGGCWHTKGKNTQWSFVFCAERWPGWGDRPKIVCEGVRVWCWKELWVSDTGDYLCQRSSPIKDSLCGCFSSLHFHICVFFHCFSSTHNSSTFLSVSLFFRSYFYHLHLSCSSMSLCLLNLLFLVFSDTGGRVHAVCHDSWNQTELDRGFKEVYSAQQLSRPHTVIATGLLKYHKASLTESKYVFQI